jgi:hypothetical protein
MVISPADKNDDRYDTNEEEFIAQKQMKRDLLTLAVTTIRKPEISREFLFDEVFE